MTLPERTGAKFIMVASQGKVKGEVDESANFHSQA
jgi:hypothetical protein